LSAAEAFVEHDLAIGDLTLTSGTVVPDVVQRVTIFGSPRADGSNVVFAPHALTGSSRVSEWWAGFAGTAGSLFDPAQWCVIGINVLGGCYGSTGPTTLAHDGRRYGPRFPVVTVEDMVVAQHQALALLGIQRLAVVVGGSLGGFQALAWARQYPEMVGHAIAIGAHDHLRAQAIAQNGLAREAIRLDPAYKDGWYEEQPIGGLQLARAIATLTYKSEALFEKRFANKPDRAGGDPRAVLDDRFDVDGYLAYQGVRFAARSDANSYRTLTRAMDLFDLRTAIAPAGSTRLTFVSITGDQLFFPAHIEAAAERWRAGGWNATFLQMQSEHGHDAFLAEAAMLGNLLREHIARPNG
jgi:homoserine O-acetyltransferase/O-succinyltransferase